MNDKNVLKVAFESFKFGPGKYGEFSAAPTVDPTMATVHFNKRHVRDLAPIYIENKRCTSQHTRIATVVLSSA